MAVKTFFKQKKLKKKSKNTLYEKYGVFYTSHLPNYKPSTGSKSSLHKIISKELKNNKIFHKMKLYLNHIIIITKETLLHVLI